MTRPNILVITNLYPYPWEPNRAIFNKQQFEKLAEIANVKVIVLVPWTSAVKNICKLKTRVNNGVEITYCVYLYPPKFGRSFYPVFIFLSLLTHLWQIKKFRPDSMLLSWAFPDAIAGSLLARLLKVPTLIKVHGSDINVHATVKERRAQINRAMQQAESIISVSQDLKNKILEMGVAPEKVHVLYNGIDKSLFHPVEKSVARKSCGIDIQRKVILFIGNLKVSKGSNLLMEAYILLVKQDPDVDLYFIGTGDQINILKRLATENSLEGNVHFLGAVAHGQLNKWVNASDVLALPSMNEGVPNVILEAQACGIPVVATNVGGIPEIVSLETGILVEYGDKEILSDALQEALCKNWDRSKISNNKNILSWQDNAAKLLNIIKTAIVQI